MTGISLAAVSSASFLLDLIPVVGIILLILAFVRGRHRRRMEERRLNEAIRRFGE